MKFTDALKEIFPEDTEEYEIVTEAYRVITSSAPVLSAEAKTKMMALDNSRVDLSSLYFMVCRNISKLKNSAQKIYDAQYTRLVKLGRPSNAAIEAEIRMSSPEYASASSRINDYEEIKDLLSMYIRCIDSSKSTTVELLRDSKRLD